MLNAYFSSVVSSIVNVYRPGPGDCRTFARSTVLVCNRPKCSHPTHLDPRPILCRYVYRCAASCESQQAHRTIHSLTMHHRCFMALAIAPGCQEIDPNPAATAWVLLIGQKRTCGAVKKATSAYINRYKLNETYTKTEKNILRSATAMTLSFSETIIDHFTYLLTYLPKSYTVSTHF